MQAMQTERATPVAYGVASKDHYGAGGLYSPVESDAESVDFERGAEDDLDEGVRKALRLGFIRKVYGILSLQLLLTAVVSAVLTEVQACRDFVLANPALLWVGFFASIGILFALMAYKDRHPLNAKLLFAWTLVEAYTVGVVCAAYTAAGQGALVLEALFLTFSVFAVLTLFTFQSKIDFSFLGAGLGAALWILIIWGVVSAFLGDAGGGIYSLFGATIFSGYIVFDTWLITQKLGYDDYILAAVTLYLDLINLFLYILQILARNDRS
ncbi:inhibitor of apoptosis-promoting Bax1-domain-containing protein [Pelagophyceae sp. CCMP2097]|nr:inhibitor of apoptosis-promoting Bax1-domain-containing protein [Pelagophyceae sp. CCMP2097]|mmetsp:Transcript_33157/g.114051  ORF Transcript_33157/g.114051 Transcript_33157/m.114051 type:complete len:268 (-) Transcript_33157:31-834(-)